MPPRQDKETIRIDDASGALERFRKEYWKNDKELSSTYQFLMHPYDESEPDEDFNLKVNELQLMIDDLKLLRKLGFK